LFFHITVPVALLTSDIMVKKGQLTSYSHPVVVHNMNRTRLKRIRTCLFSACFIWGVLVILCREASLLALEDVRTQMIVVTFESPPSGVAEYLFLTTTSIPDAEMLKHMKAATFEPLARVEDQFLTVLK
jgi:hypothetical protein